MNTNYVQSQRMVRMVLPAAFACSGALLLGCGVEFPDGVRPTIESADINGASGIVTMSIHYEGGDDPHVVASPALQILESRTAEPFADYPLEWPSDFDPDFGPGESRVVPIDLAVPAADLDAWCARSVNVRVTHKYEETPGLTSFSVPFDVTIVCE